MYSIKMSDKTFKFDNNEVNKKEFHASKQPITLNLVNVNQILISDKLRVTIKVLNILLGTKMIISLHLCAIFQISV